jgi:hypothetical protein
MGAARLSALFYAPSPINRDSFPAIIAGRNFDMAVECAKSSTCGRGNVGGTLCVHCWQNHPMIDLKTIYKNQLGGNIVCH